MKRVLVCLGVLSMFVFAVLPASAAVSEAYIFTQFVTVPPPQTDVPFTLTGTAGVRMLLNSSGVATAAVNGVTGTVIPVGMALDYVSHTGTIDLGEPGAGTAARVNLEAKRLDDVGFQEEGGDSALNVDYSAGASVTWSSPSTTFIVIAEDAGLDVLRLEFNDGGGFVTLFDGFDAGTQSTILSRADVGTNDSDASQIDQFYVFFFDAPLPAGQFRITEIGNIAKPGQTASELLEIDFVGIIPEPTTGLLVAAGLLSFAMLRRRR
jgi:hypothetical protein